MNFLTAFEKDVLAAAQKIPLGKATTYKEVAKKIGQPKAVRAVGNALNKNPNTPNIPCHRIVKSNGRVGGYARGMLKKIKLLKSEGIHIKNGKIRDFKKVLARL